MTVLETADLDLAYKGSWYTIVGAGGDPQAWVIGIEGALDGAGIGKPVAWYQTSGAAVNWYAKPPREQDAFPDDLVILMFPLEGLHVGKLAMFKLAMGDRWLDDVIDNMRR